VFPKDDLLSIYAHIRVHLGIRENFHGIYPSGVHIFFSKSTCVLTGEFFKEKLVVISFQKCVGLSFLFWLIDFFYFHFSYFF